MNIKEFRVGNYVFDEDGEVYQLRPIYIYNISVNPDCFKPMPLTEEWLLKFGFDKYEDGGELKGNDCYYGIKKTGIVIGLTPKFNLLWIS